MLLVAVHLQVCPSSEMDTERNDAMEGRSTDAGCFRKTSRMLFIPSRTSVCC